MARWPGNGKEVVVIRVQEQCSAAEVKVPNIMSRIRSMLTLCSLGMIRFGDILQAVLVGLTHLAQHGLHGTVGQLLVRTFVPIHEHDIVITFLEMS